MCIQHIMVKLTGFLIFMSPLSKGRGTYCFWCRSYWRSSDTYLSVQYLVNQWSDSNQICMDTSLGQGKDVIRFCDHDLLFKVRVATRGQILTKFAWIHHWDSAKNWLDFGDLDLILKVTMATTGQILTNFAWIHNWDSGKNRFGFGDLDLIFKVTVHLNVNFKHAQCLVNQWSDSCQICIDTSMGQDTAVILLDLDFQKKIGRCR